MSAVALAKAKAELAQMTEQSKDAVASSISIVCPDGVGPGDVLAVEHEGQAIDVQVPEGVGPGDEFEVTP